MNMMCRRNRKRRGRWRRRKRRGRWRRRRKRRGSWRSRREVEKEKKKEM
jgi:hypothetical protein